MLIRNSHFVEFQISSTTAVEANDFTLVQVDDGEVIPITVFSISKEIDIHIHIREIEIENYCESSKVHHRGSDSIASKYIGLDLIIMFFLRLMMLVTDRIPDNVEFHLPHFQK